jgi:hypothetical protein
MCHTPSSDPDDEPTEDFEVRYIGDGEHGFIGIIQTKFRAPEERDIPVEEQQAAAYRYIQARYAGGIYDKMVHRETDGPDPLVQEPKGKP